MQSRIFQSCNTTVFMELNINVIQVALIKVLCEKNHKVARTSFVVICISAALEKLIAFTALVNNKTVLIFWLRIKCRA